MPGRLAGKTAIVTGSSSGLGRAIALAYGKEGANVCCADLYDFPRDPDATGNDFNARTDVHLATVEVLHRKYGDDRAMFIQVDVTQAGLVESLVHRCVMAFGRVDIMVNDAGISVESTHPRALRIHETPERDYDQTMAVNAKGVFLGCKYAIKQMLEQPLLPGERDRGWIINTASVQGLVAYWGTSSYCASKGAVVQLTKQVALDYGRDRIHCNALCPGFLQTLMTQNLRDDPGLLAKTNEAHPFGGMGTVEDVARAAVFLASSDAAWVTGVPLPVDGGLLTL